MGQVNTPSNLIDRVRKLEKDLAEVRKRAGLGNAAISAGDLTIQDGGTFRLRHPNGTIIATVGNLGGVNGEDVWGVQFRRPDGSDAIIAYGTASGASTYCAFKDRSGNIVFSDDGVSGQGIGTPWMPYPLPVPGGIGHWPSSTSTSWATISDAFAKATHPRIAVFAATDHDSGTTGRVRVLVNGTQIGAPVTAPANIEFTAAVPGWGSTVHFQDDMHVELQTIRDTGSGAIYAAAYSLYGVQS